MKMKPSLLVLNCLLGLSALLITLPIVGQTGPKDSVIGAPLISPSFALQQPGGDLVNRFGMNGAVGLQLMYKTKHNWIIGVSGDYLFGNQVKETHMLDSIVTHDNSANGFLISNNGKLVDRFFSERGFSTFIKIGKLFPCFGPNENSGIMVLGGVGFLEHQIHIQLVDGTDQITPQLNAQMRLGYDRLSNGLAFNEAIGYLFLANNRIFNFYAVLDFTEGFTQDRRYDYDLNSQSNKVNKDVLYGFRFGWILPIYKRIAKEFYTY